MKAYSRSINPDLLRFWYDNAKPGLIGLVHIDFVTAKLINWVERRITPDGEPSPWAHVFLFLKPRHGIPWIAESDLFVPLPGVYPKPNGPQVNPIYKWSHPGVDRAIIVDPLLAVHQIERLEDVVGQLLRAGYTYRIGELAEAWVALNKHDLTYRGKLHRDDAMHCGHFVRECLHALNCDPFGPDILPDNTVPELVAQAFPAVAHWPAPIVESE